MNYENYEKMAFGLAHRYTLATNLSYEDCLEAVMEAFVRAVEMYDPSIGAFSTWFHQVARGEITKELRRYQVGKTVPLDWGGEGFMSEIPAPDANLMFEATLKQLSRDARIVAQLALDVDVEFEANNSNFRKKIKQIMRGVGWKERRITKAFSELKEALS